ncbi:MAG: 3-dehydroquinate synthase [Candidatus Shikimatogenerans sp. JK-2022]|nr:3-dehydroquinate synthase [Candidatus Shikimatogenerans bostrichidophilus]
MYKKIDNIIISNKLKYFKKIIKKEINKKIIILLDNNIKKIWLNKLYKYIPLKIKYNINIININYGEKYKNIITCIYIWKKLIKLQIDKNSVLINLGGGVISDLGGFIASLFKRGIKYINIPTTLLSMVDASIGGKNGINFYKLKNEIGIINNPYKIFICLEFLKTLSKIEILSGFGEILKYGLIYNKNFWYYINKFNILKIKNWFNIVYKSIKIKNKIVKQDPKELLGLRKILNFGHTIGHAIESLFLFKKKKITHGEAIVLGIICESWISKKINNLSNKEYKKICKFILTYYNIRIIKKKYFKYIINIIKNDKKNLNNNIYFVLLKKIGLSVYNKKVNKKLIFKSIIKMNKLKK